MAFHNNVFNTTQIRPWDKPTTTNSIGIITTHPPGQYPIGLTELAFSKTKNIRVKSYINNVKFIESDGTFSATLHLDAWSDTILFFAACTWLPLPQPDREFQHGKVTIKGDQLTYSLTFGQEYASAPKVVVWLNGLDLCKDTGWHVNVEAAGVTTKGFTLKCNSWKSAKIHQVQVTWIAYPGSRPNIDSGQFDTSEVLARQDMQHNNSKTVQFMKKFERTPKVYFALSGIDSNNSTDLRVKTYATDAKLQGVTLHINSWAEPNMHGARGQWIAIQDM